VHDANLLVGADTLSDAGVYLLAEGLAIVQTTDFFPPVVNDPYVYGQIAAANALSDVYAMGAVPRTALNIVGFPVSELGLEVRRVPRAGEGAETSSGVCRLRERVWVLLSPADPPARRAAVLAAALREHAGDALESRYLPPAVRARLERAGDARAERTPGGPAPDPGSLGAT